MRSLLIAAWLVCQTLPGLAQTPPVSEAELETEEGESPVSTEAETAAQARTLFDDARQARVEGRLSDSRDLLVQSLSLVPRASTAINLARIHLAMGQATLAQDLLLSLAEGEFGELEDPQTTHLGELIDELNRRIAVLRVEIESPGSVELRIDGSVAAAPSPGRPASYPLDAGHHNIWAQSLGQSQEQRILLVAGQRETLRFLFEDEVVAPAGSPNLAWLWITLGVLAAGAVAGLTIWAVTGDDSPAHDPDGVFDVISALTFP